MEMPPDADVFQWTTRAKRSKRASSPPQPDAGDLAAAESLILLAYSGGGFCSTAIDTASTIMPPKKRQEISPSAAVFAEGSEAAAGATTSATVIVKKQKAASPDTPLLPPYNHNISHNCWVCGKVFQTSKALGGHMTSHSLKIVNGAASDDKGRHSAAAESGRVHECSCCHQKFATGQALGGHKRKHYNGPAIARKAANCSNSSTSFNRIAGDSSGESSDGGAATRPLFDLNLPPPDEE